MHERSRITLSEESELAGELRSSAISLAESQIDFFLPLAFHRCRFCTTGGHLSVPCSSSSDVRFRCLRRRDIPWRPSVGPCSSAMDAGTDDRPAAHRLVYRRCAICFMETRELPNADRCMAKDASDILPAHTGARDPGPNSKAALGHHPQRTCGGEPLNRPVLQGYLAGGSHAWLQPWDTRMELPGHC